MGADNDSQIQELNEMLRQHLPATWSGSVTCPAFASWHATIMDDYGQKRMITVAGMDHLGALHDLRLMLGAVLQSPGHVHRTEKDARDCHICAQYPRMFRFYLPNE